MSFTTDLIEQEVEDAGYKRGTPRFEVRVRALKVLHCRNAKYLDYCSQCVAFDHCEIQKEHVKDLKNGTSSVEDE